MNEQRLQAYYQLIESLLGCPSGEEAEILAANQELLDAGFLQVVAAVAEHFAQQGQENTADWLRNLAANLAPKTTSITEENIQTYLQFILEVLRTTSESNGDAQIVYPLLAANTDKLNNIFAELLRRWATNTLGEAEAEANTATSIAAVIGNFSNLIQEFPLGSKANNMEIAITGYEIALTVYTRRAFPQQWATTQNNLGITYRDRIFGEKAENIENAIAAFSAALSVRTRTAFPQDWAMTQNNLGIAYRDRIFGEKTENIENAIAAFSAALSVRTRTTFPQDWATTLINLGNAYLEKTTGSRAENIEQAIAAYTDALGVYTRTAFPQDWATTLINLGNAYLEKTTGSKAENIEQAIAAYTDALGVYTRTAFPQDWATTQNNLGTAYSKRILGEKAENIEQAIAAYTDALEVYTRTAFPQDWATTQNNLGTAYSKRILGEKAENIEQAIAAYTDALEVYTRTAFPQDWATTLINLGNAYLDRILGDKGKNIEQAITTYKTAQEVYTQNAFAKQWTMIQNNLDIAYGSIIVPKKIESIEQIIAVYISRTEALFNIGNTYQNFAEFDLAYTTYESAIINFEYIRECLIKDEGKKQNFSDQWSKLYSNMVKVCIHKGEYIKAIEYIERSKTRNLVELIFQGDLKTIFPLEIVTKIEQLNDKITSSQYQLQNGKASNPTALAQDIQTWRQQRQDLQDRYLPVGSSFRFEQFQQTLDDNTVIIEWYITADNILAFIIKPNGQQLTYWQSQPEELQALVDWQNAYLKDYYNQEDKNKVQWQHQLETRLQKLAEILHLEEIIAQLPAECHRLILVPHLFLHLFPLHALPVKNSFLMDLFPQGVSYAPSCQILQQVQLRQRPNFQSLFAIQNPTEDLVYTDLEVDSILNMFPSHQVLSKKQATKDALIQEIPKFKDANYLHFSCHGSFNLDFPQDSCLLLAESVDENKNLDLNKCLTLGSLFERNFRLDKCRLVVLSACETGLVDYTNMSDEYISLPSGFLYAGSVGVVSSLWAVNDLSTAFLMIKFSQNLQTSMVESGDFSAAVELQKAQNWLRNATTAELQTWASQLELSPETNKQLEKFLYYCKHYCEPEEKQFQNPYHWASFCAIGL